MGDYWTEGDTVFNHNGKKFVLNANCRTVCLGPVDEVSEPTKSLSQQEPDMQQGCYKLPGVDNYQGKRLPSDVTSTIRALIRQGLSTRVIAKRTGVSNITVYRIMQKPLLEVVG